MSEIRDAVRKVLEGSSVLLKKGGSAVSGLGNEAGKVLSGGGDLLKEGGSAVSGLGSEAGKVLSGGNDLLKKGGSAVSGLGNGAGKVLSGGGDLLKEGGSAVSGLGSEAGKALSGGGDLLMEGGDTISEVSDAVGKVVRLSRDMLKEGGNPMSEIVDEIREAFRESDDIRDAGLTTPEDIIRFDDLLYGEDPDWQKLDVYRPRSAGREKLPVLISVHGGGWIYGDKERYQYYCMSLAQRGFAVVNFTYRLAPEFRFPAPVEDTNLVAGWTMAHAEEYGFDTEHIFAVGDSAGAHILSLYADICTNPDYAKGYDFRVPEGFALKALALNCGIYRLTRAEDQGADLMEMMGKFLPEGGTKEELVWISPVRHITNAFPPVTLMTCTGDFLKGQAPVLEQKLLEKNVPHEFHYYVDPGMELGHVFHLNMKSEEAALCNDQECEFFRRFL